MWGVGILEGVRYATWFLHVMLVVTFLWLNWVTNIHWYAFLHCKIFGEWIYFSCFPKVGAKRMHSTVLYCTVLYCTVLRCAARRGTARHGGTALHCTALHGAARRCTARHGTNIGIFCPVVGLLSICIYKVCFFKIFTGQWISWLIGYFTGRSFW